MYLTVNDASRIYGWAKSYVYRLAYLEGWSRITVDGHARYLTAQVQATYDRRHR